MNLTTQLQYCGLNTKATDLMAKGMFTKEITEQLQFAAQSVTVTLADKTIQCQNSRLQPSYLPNSLPQLHASQVVPITYFRFTSFNWSVGGKNFYIININNCSLSLQPSFGPWQRLRYLDPTHGRISRTEDQPLTRPLPTHRTTQTRSRHTQTSMPRVGFYLTAQFFEGGGGIHALGCVANVLGSSSPYRTKSPPFQCRTLHLLRRILGCYAVWLL
jgi:hypothetical protein